MEDELEAVVDLAAAGLVTVGAAKLAVDVMDWQSRLREERKKKDEAEARCPCL